MADEPNKAAAFPKQAANEPPTPPALREPRRKVYKRNISDFEIYLKPLTPEQFGALFYASIRYDLYGIDEPPADPALQIPYEMGKVIADKMLETYRERCEINARNASKGQPEISEEDDARYTAAIEDRRIQLPR